MNKNGTFTWAVGFGGAGTATEITYSIGVDSSDNIYAGGAIGCDVPAKFGNFTLVGDGNPDNTDAFLAKARGPATPREHSLYTAACSLPTSSRHPRQSLC